MSDNVVVNDAFISIEKSFPIKFDDVTIPFYPSSWSRGIPKVEDVKQSEGGTQIVQLIYVGRKSFPFSFAVADDTWLDTFEQFNDKDDFMLSIYSPRTHAYDVIKVRMLNYVATPRKRSEKLTAVAGVWDVSFTLEAFS